MNPSLFVAYIEKYFPNYVASVSESLNGRSLTNQIPFLFLQLLTPRFTADSRWQAVSALYQGIAADVIALGSATPLKGRDSTVDMVAKLGRSSRLGERSRGVMDAGSASCYLILHTMADTIKELIAS